jgi:hypothetical protein
VLLAEEPYPFEHGFGARLCPLQTCPKLLILSLKLERTLWAIPTLSGQLIQRLEPRLGADRPLAVASQLIAKVMDQAGQLIERRERLLRRYGI